MLASLVAGRDAMTGGLPGRVSIVSVVLTRPEGGAGHWPRWRLPSISVAEQSHDPSAHPTTIPTREAASLARRFAALFADWMLCVLVSGLFANPTTSGWPPVAVLVLEYTFFVGLFGQTPGMWLTRIRCVSLATGRPVGLARAALRGVLLCLVVPPLLLDRDRRGWHDRVTGTIVVPAARAAA